MPTPVAYYNEIDPFAAQWLRNLIQQDLIAPGEVDERDIRDVTPGDLAGFTQCHFFAGIGVWSYSLRRAGWPDDSPIWTGSCPCQPFSAAGQGAGFTDERHLWPAFFHLIEMCRPAAIFGEQVASKDGLTWLDLVQADLEGAGYASRALDMCAAGVGAPHIRQRLWFVARPMADTSEGGREILSTSRLHEDGQSGNDTARCSAPVIVADTPSSGSGTGLRDSESAGQRRPESADRSGTVGLGDTSVDGDRQHARELSSDEGQHEVGTAHSDHAPEHAGAACVVGDSEREGLEGFTGHGDYPRGRSFALGSAAAAGAVGGFWSDAWWVYCRDEKLRPVEPGSFPLVNGAPSRVGRLRAYGNAINAEAAKEVIVAAMSIL
jgi:DNA (cytosine-5)-methyltransferase 1